MAALDTLLRLVPAPAALSEVADEQGWASVEKALGVTLPQDIFDLAATYGSGWFRGSVGHTYRIENPYSRRFPRQVKAWQAVYADLRANGVYSPFPGDLYPADPGLLCVGFGESPIALFISLRERKPDGDVFALTYQREWVRA